MSMFRERSIANSQLSVLLIEIEPPPLLCSGFAGSELLELHALDVFTLTLNEPPLISGQNGGGSYGGQMGGPQSNIGGGGAGITQSSIKSKSTTGTNGTAQFLKRGSAIILRKN